jgi:hypothetical protein
MVYVVQNELYEFTNKDWPVVFIFALWAKLDEALCRITDAIETLTSKLEKK